MQPNDTGFVSPETLDAIKESASFSSGQTPEETIGSRISYDNALSPAPNPQPGDTMLDAIKHILEEDKKQRQLERDNMKLGVLQTCRLMHPYLC